ncbi:MAG: methyltransferase [Gemmatimonadetes bacterium]|nr:methyltransferase [Gemmatimonadota bacterium]
MAPAGRDVRPTLDRVREAWMSIVHPLLVDARVLDLFAGSGALGLEALSRGAASADLVETATPSLHAIAGNIAALDADDVARVHRVDALKYASGLDAHAYDVAFADPPYEMGLSQQVATRWLEVPFADVLGIEHRWFEKLPAGGELRRYGDSAITFYRSN